MVCNMLLVTGHVHCVHSLFEIKLLLLYMDDCRNGSFSAVFRLENVYVLCSNHQLLSDFELLFNDFLIAKEEINTSIAVILVLVNFVKIKQIPSVFNTPKAGSGNLYWIFFPPILILQYKVYFSYFLNFFFLSECCN